MSTGAGRVPASAGIRWFATSLAAIRTQPWLLASIAILYLSAMGFLTVLPYVGTVLAALFMPFGTVYLGRGTRDALAGRRPLITLLTSAWNDRPVRRQLLCIGLFFAAVVLAANVVYAVLSADEVALWKIMEDDRLDWQSVRDNLPLDAFAGVAAVYIPGLMSTWFAPLLASEKGMSWGKSLFYSFFGCLRNIVPILLLGVILAAVGTAVAAAAITVSSLPGLGSFEMFILVPAAVLFSTVSYSCYWPMFASIFGGVARDRG